MSKKRVNPNLQKDINQVYSQIKDFGVTKQQLMKYIKESEQANRVLEKQRKSGLYYGNRTQFTWRTLGQAKTKEQLDEWFARPQSVISNEYVGEFNEWLRGNIEVNLQDMYGGAVSVRKLSDRQLGKLMLDHPEFQELFNPSPKPGQIGEMTKLLGSLYDNSNRINMLVDRYSKL